MKKTYVKPECEVCDLIIKTTSDLFIRKYSRRY